MVECTANALQPSPLTPILTSSLCCCGRKSNGCSSLSLCTIEATGLGLRDLSCPIPWDISILSDKAGQSVYGPSLAPIEETVSMVRGPFGGSQTLQVTALARSKAAHEFLVLHYFDVGSAMHWNILHVGSHCLRFSSRVPQHARGSALEMFGAYAHRAVPPQDTSRVMDRGNDLELQSFDGR